jgi:chromate transporter
MIHLRLNDDSIVIVAQVLYFLRLGATGFGGPIALVGRMERDLVEDRGWFSQSEFARGLALAQVAPGPLAAQLAMYLGWLRGGVLGATTVGLAFVAPSFLIVLGIAVGYASAGALPWMRAAFYGVAAAVIAVLARSAVRLLRRTVPREGWAWVVAAANGVVVVLTGRELVAVLLLSGCVPLLRLASRRAGVAAGFAPGMLAAIVAAGAMSAPAELFVFFAKAGTVVFGSGLAIIPFLHGEVVTVRGWLTEQQFLDAVAVAMLTPGPVVITVAFIGWLVDGLSGATAAALGVFAPVWLVVILVAPVYQRIMENPWIRAFSGGVIAAAAGALSGAVIVLAQRAVFDVPTALIAGLSLAALLRWRRLPEPLVLASAAVAGLVVAQ